MQQAASSRAARRAAEAVIGCSLVTAVLLGAAERSQFGAGAPKIDE